MPETPWHIDGATQNDLPELGRLGALLMRTHHDFDPDRFIAPGDDPEGGYAWFLGTQLGRDDSRVLVARQGDDVVGYLLAALEPHSWKELRDAAGFIHDLAVAEHARGQGIGHALMDAGIAWLRAQGAPRVVLWTAAANEGAARMFTSQGFRRTMIEMTKEL